MEYSLKKYASKKLMLKKYEVNYDLRISIVCCAVSAKQKNLFGMLPTSGNLSGSFYS